MLRTTVDRRNTNGRNARHATIVRRTAAVRMLLNEADPRSRRCPYADPPRRVAGSQETSN